MRSKIRNGAIHASRRGLKRGLLLLLFVPAMAALAQDSGDNGIHVGEAKVYDDRQLTIMLDSLNQSLQGKNFVNQNALAGALGNVQGYQNTDTSSAFFANGAAGPQAAAVFAGSLPAGSSASSTAPAPAAVGSSGASPSVTINVNPAASATPAASSSPTTLGPQAPTLPTLQTAPGYNPTFGPSSNDLLTDEVNLTYQIYNLSLLLNRSLTDRTFNHESRLQAVVGFDIDIEPNAHAKNAIAIVEVTATAESCPPDMKNPTDCKPRLVALMPEQGSHNAATLTQKANAFGGALAAQVFSVGLSSQRRKQIFYLYRDIDTLSFQPVSGDSQSIKFGWQFRPVLGRQTVDAGLRHMMVVLSLPAADKGLTEGLSPEEAKREADELSPKLNITVTTHWVRYESKAQSTTTHDCVVSSFPECLFSHLPPAIGPINQRKLAVPITAGSQHDLEPRITNVKWVPTSASNGVAIVTGDNFFLGTTARVGNRTLTGANDGLTLKSDKELEIALPSSAVLEGGVLSGRYGVAKEIRPDRSSALADGFYIRTVSISPQGNDLAQVTAQLVFSPPSAGPGRMLDCSLPAAAQRRIVFENGSWLEVDTDKDNKENTHKLAYASTTTDERALNFPVLSVDGKADSLQTSFDFAPRPEWECNGRFPPGSLVAQVNSIVPAKDVASSSQFITVTFPFQGREWTQSFAHFTPTLKIDRLGSDKRAKLLISSTSPGDTLCDGWSVQTDACEIVLTADGAKPPACPVKTEKQKTGKENDKEGKKDKKDEKDKTPAPPVLGCIGDSGAKPSLNYSAKLTLDIAASDLTYKRLFLVHRTAKSANPNQIDDTRIGDIPDAKPKAPKPTLADGQNPTIAQYTAKTITFKGTHLDGITSVLFDKTPLNIVKQDDDTMIVISISRVVTARPGGDQIQLLSDGNDPLIANLTVTPAATASAKGNKKP